MDLPAQHSAGPYRVAVVCLGNICRSPMAHVVLDERLRRAGRGAGVGVDSAGTGGWHVGGPWDTRAAATLEARGYDPSGHRAAQFTPGHSGEHDLVLAMDSDNRADLQSMGVGPALRLFRDFDPEGPGDVPDPYYGGEDGFASVLDMVERTSDSLVRLLQGQA